MNSTWAKLAGCVLPIVLLATGCTGTRTFTTAARGGETVALAVGYRQHLQRKNMTVMITDSLRATVTYPPNDTRVRGVVNLYPDPVSKLIVGNDTGQTLGVGALNYAYAIENNGFPGGAGTTGDSDWWLTTVLLDLPTTMANGNAIAIGQAKIEITDTGGNSILPASVEILSGQSTLNPFEFYGIPQVATQYPSVQTQFPKALPGMERADNFTVTFQMPKDINGYDVIPHSLEAVFTHTTNVGVAVVINPRGDLKNVIWSDDGTNLKVMVTPPNGKTLVNAIDMKFYVAGGITSLALVQSSLKAYDINGTPMSGVVTATVTAQ